MHREIGEEIVKDVMELNLLGISSSFKSKECWRVAPPVIRGFLPVFCFCIGKNGLFSESQRWVV